MLTSESAGGGGESDRGGGRVISGPSIVSSGGWKVEERQWFTAMLFFTVCTLRIHVHAGVFCSIFFRISWSGQGNCELYFAHVGTIKRKAKAPVVLERIWTKIQFKDTYVFLSTCKQPRGEDSCPLQSVRPPGSEHPRPSRSTIQIRDGQKKELTIKVRVQQPYSPGNPLPKPELMFLAVFGKL